VGVDVAVLQQPHDRPLEPLQSGPELRLDLVPLGLLARHHLVPVPSVRRSEGTGGDARRQHQGPILPFTSRNPRRQPTRSVCTTNRRILLAKSPQGDKRDSYIISRLSKAGPGSCFCPASHYGTSRVSRTSYAPANSPAVSLRLGETADEGVTYYPEGSAA
jgi:hypothetical protein